MNTEVYDSETVDVLARWWWPGQWLRIVWSVWADQKWYWRHVYPRLENRRSGWGIFVRTWLGFLLITACQLVVLGLIFDGPIVAGIERQFMWLLSGVSIAFITLVCFVINRFAGAVMGVPAAATCIVAPVLYLLVHYASFSIYGQWRWLGYAALCLTFGVFGGIFWGLFQGRVGLYAHVAVALTISLMASGETPPGFVNALLMNLASIAVAFVLGGAAMYAGARWATRDLTGEAAERLKKV